MLWMHLLAWQGLGFEHKPDQRLSRRMALPAICALQLCTLSVHPQTVLSSSACLCWHEGRSDVMQLTV